MVNRPGGNMIQHMAGNPSWLLLAFGRCLHHFGVCLPGLDEPRLSALLNIPSPSFDYHHRPISRPAIWDPVQNYRDSGSLFSDLLPLAANIAPTTEKAD